jgi:tripartite-type tricarboxylate transporter receptor subunit TctC
METLKVKTCFTITYTQDQYQHARAYVQEMKKHPQRVYWWGKEGKTEDELVVEQIAHRILSGFYNNEPFKAGKQIVRMDSMTF